MLRDRLDTVSKIDIVAVIVIVFSLI